MQQRAALGLNEFLFADLNDQHPTGGLASDGDLVCRQAGDPV
jgi:hypothetical protein